MSRVVDPLGPRPRLTLVICEQQVAEIWVEGRAPIITLRDYDWGEIMVFQTGFDEVHVFWSR